MRNLFLFGLLAVAFIAFGCGSNPAGNIAGPSKTTQSNLPATQQEEFNWLDEYIGPPQYTELELPVSAGALAFYGTVSNLSGGSFTLTAPDGRSVSITTDENTQVLALGSFAAVDASALANDQLVSVWGHIEGRPSGPPGEGTAIDAVLIVINARTVNGLIVAD